MTDNYSHHVERAGMTHYPKLRYPAKCRQCGAGIPAGSAAFRDDESKQWECVVHAEAVVDELAPQMPTADVAGASAKAIAERARQRDQAKHEQRTADDTEWRVAIVAKRPVLGRIATALTPKPSYQESRTARNYGKGGAGEDIVGEWLDKIAGVEVLHDRRWPGTRSSNIDHIAVGPSGVFVVDAKNWTGRIEQRNKGNIFKADYRLYVGGRDQSKTTDGVRAQAEALRGVLGAEFESVPIQGALCFTGGEWGFPKVTFVAGGVSVLWPRKLEGLVAAPGNIPVQAVAEKLRSALPPAARA